MSPTDYKTVWVSGAGAVTCVGRDSESLWSAIRENRTGIREGLGPVEVNGSVKDGRALAFAIEAAKQAMSNAGVENLDSTDGLILATTTGQIDCWDDRLIEFLRASINSNDFADSFKTQSLGNMLGELRTEFNHTGPSLVVTSACGAATQAIALGTAWIRQGKVKRCLVGGSEALCRLTVEGFKSLQLLSPTPAKPFDRDRTGINLSEGAGFIVLEAAKPVRPLAKVSGFGFSADAFHMTGPHPEGRGARRAMHLALSKAGLVPKDISWIHAHGTGSDLNDVAEAAALNAVFKVMPPVASTKWVHGHALGASGAIESVVCLESMRRQMIAKSSGLENPDPRISLNHSFATAPMAVTHIMKNTLGFGGINATLIFSHPDAGIA